ncbi:MAG: hypothetical protein ACK5JF_03865 [Oscillospiraceae bacterium]
MNQDTIVEYKTKHGSATFAFESDFWIDSIDGASSVTINIDAVQSVQQTGSSISGQQVQPKTMVITGEILGDIERNRRRMLNIIRPLEPAQLMVMQDSYTAIIDGYPSVTPLFNEGNGKQNFQFKFYCPWPYWKLGDVVATPFKSVFPLFSFPFNTGGKWFISKYNESRELNVRNAGTVSTGFRVEWTVTSIVTEGVLRLQNLTTGEYIRAGLSSDYVSAGNVLELSTVDGDRHFINMTTGKGLYNQLTNFTALQMRLRPGDNYFKMDNEALDTKCTIYAPQGVLSGV